MRSEGPANIETFLLLFTSACLPTKIAGGSCKTNLAAENGTVLGNWLSSRSPFEHDNLLYYALLSIIPPWGVESCSMCGAL